MNKEVESMTAGSSADNGYSEKRSHLGAHRKAETESLMKLLSQRRELRESGLSEEDTESMNELEVEIKELQESTAPLSKGRRRDDVKFTLALFVLFP
jgi:hypothetical protein